MEESKLAEGWWQQGCPASRSAVFLHSLHSRLSGRILQDHFTRFGTVLKILRGSCGRCGLVFFASPDAAHRVNSVTQLVRGRELCPLLVDEDTAKQFWQSSDDQYLCDSCVSFTEKEDEDRLFIDVDEEGVKGTDKEPCTKAAPEPCLRAWSLSQIIQRERKSLRLLRHLKKQCAWRMFKKEQQSYKRLQSLMRIDSMILVLRGKEEASVRLLRHLSGGDGEEHNLKRKEEESLTLLRHLKGTAAKGHM